MCAEFDKNERAIKKGLSKIIKSLANNHSFYRDPSESHTAAYQDFNLASLAADLHYPKDGDLENFLNNLKLKEVEDTSLKGFPPTKHLLVRWHDLHWAESGEYEVENPQTTRIRDFVRKSLEDYSRSERWDPLVSTLTTLEYRGIIPS